LIDNDFKNQPKFNFTDYDKILVCKMSNNVFVNPAWNYGVFKSKSPLICLLSDDVYISEQIINYICSLDFTKIDIVGSYSSDKDVLELQEIKVDKSINIGSYHYGFGCAMFMRRTSYTQIPHLYKIWYGDDYLVHNSKNAFKIGICKDGLKFSETINSFPKNSVVKKRIEMDINNARRFLLKKS